MVVRCGLLQEWNIDMTKQEKDDVIYSNEDHISNQDDVTAKVNDEINPNGSAH